jgi:hypothetical protein
MAVSSIDDLPDVRLYIERNDSYLRSGKADKWDHMMLSTGQSAPGFPIPTGCYLPGTIDCDGRESEVVYEIRGYLEDNTADMTVYIADSNVTPGPGCILRRRAKSASGRISSQVIAVFREGGRCGE